MHQTKKLTAYAACATMLVIATIYACASDDLPTATPIPPTPIPTNTAMPTATPTPASETLTAAMAAEQLPIIGPERTYELHNTQEWLNSEPTTIAALRDAGQVVLIDFWTYT